MWYIIHYVGDDGTNYYYGPWRQYHSVVAWIAAHPEFDGIDEGYIVTLSK